MDLKLFLSTFALIFIAELPDKTAFATLLMSARGRPWPIFFGVALAFVIQTAIAVCFGNLIGKIAQKWVHLGAGLLFLVFGYLEWKKSLKAEEEEVRDDVLSQGAPGFLRASWGAFLVIFVAEWGDLTQLATATLAAQTSNPVTIFISATLALWTVTALAILLGRYVKRFVHEGRLQKIAAGVFFLVGMYFILKDFGLK